MNAMFDKDPGFVVVVVAVNVKGYVTRTLYRMPYMQVCSSDVHLRVR